MYVCVYSYVFFLRIFPYAKFKRCINICKEINDSKYYFAVQFSPNFTPAVFVLIKGKVSLFAR